MLTKFAFAASLVTIAQAQRDVFKWSKQVQNYLDTGVFDGFVGVFEKDFKLSDDPEVYLQDWRVGLVKQLAGNNAYMNDDEEQPTIGVVGAFDKENWTRSNAIRQTTLAEFVGAKKEDDIPALYYVHSGEKMKQSYVRKYPLKFDDMDNFNNEMI